MTPLETHFAGALYRVWQIVDRSTERAHAERRAMLESARRSLGQRIRWTRHALGHPPANYTPVVFRVRRKESS